jgi:hypothetical protein
LQRLQVGFGTDWQSAAKVRHILAARSWCEPVEVLRLFKIDQAGLIEPAWFGRIRLPADYEIFDWTQLTPPERGLIEQRQRQQNWYPASLSPFQDPRRLEPLNSLGLRYRGQVVGWQITHRLAPDLIRYSALFVSPELQRLGRGISLFVNALQRQFAAGIPKALFQILTENVRAVRFVERHLVTCITAQDGYLLSFKEIDQ